MQQNAVAAFAFGGSQNSIDVANVGHAVTEQQEHQLRAGRLQPRQVGWNFDSTLDESQIDLARRTSSMPSREPGTIERPKIESLATLKRREAAVASRSGMAMVSVAT